jgi:hypothetical protein
MASRENHGARRRALARARWERTLPNNQVWIGRHCAQSRTPLGARICRFGARPLRSSPRSSALRGPCNLLSPRRFRPLRCASAGLSRIIVGHSAVCDHLSIAAARARHVATRQRRLTNRSASPAWVFAPSGVLCSVGFCVRPVAGLAASRRPQAAGSTEPEGTGAAHAYRRRGWRVSRADLISRWQTRFSRGGFSSAANESIAAMRRAGNLILTLDRTAFRGAVIFVNARRRRGSGRNGVHSSIALTMQERLDFSRR